MPDKKVVEKQTEEGVTIGYEMKPLESSSTNEYTLWAVQKVYVNIEFKVKDDKYTAGFNFVPTYGHEVRVAMAAGMLSSMPYPEGSIPYREFEHQFDRMADAVLSYRQRIITEGKSTSF